MTRLFRLHRPVILPVLALGLAVLLGGCVVYPDGYGYGYGHGYYAGGWGHHHHDHDRW